MKVLFAGVARTVSNDRPSLRIVGLHHFLSSPSSFSTHLRVRSSVGSSISHKMADETHTRTHMSTVGVFALKDAQGESDETGKRGSVALGESEMRVSQRIGCTDGSFFAGVPTVINSRLVC
uniref:Uncharacterized protein n=1 Tax=Lactuca sativa TaxID=4236 RepID=A0A9R1UV48_LACSA|nr:hypothetical protein LSAT_V11C800400040 [Lactuca sativa]